MQYLVLYTSRYLAFILIICYFSSCTSRYRTYFNTYYNANKFFNKALSKKKSRLKQNPLDLVKVTANEKELFEKAVQKSSKVLKLYSKNDQTYISKSLIILIESSYHLNNCEKVIQHYQKLNQFFPNQKNQELSQLYYLECSLLENSNILNKDRFLAKAKEIKNQKLKISILQKIAHLEEKEKEFKKSIQIYQRIYSNKSATPIQKNLFLLKQAHLYTHLNYWKQTSNILKSINTKLLNPDKKFEFYKLHLHSIKEIQSQKEAIKNLQQTIKKKLFKNKEDELLFLLSNWLVDINQISSAYQQWIKIVNLNLNNQNEWKAKSLYKLIQYYYYHENNESKRSKILQQCRISKQKFKVLKRCLEFSKIVRMITRLHKNNLTISDSIQNENNFSISETFLFDLNQIDSSIIYLNKLISKPISTNLRDKALFNLANIYENFKKNIPQSKKIYLQLLKEYPNSAYAPASQRKADNRINNPNREQKAKILYRKSELEPKKAITILEKLLKLYPTTTIAVQAEFKLSYLYEKKYSETRNKKYLYLARKKFHKIAYSKTHPYDSIAKEKISVLNLSKKDSVFSKTELQNPNVSEFFRNIYNNSEYYEKDYKQPLQEEEEEEIEPNFQ